MNFGPVPDNTEIQRKLEGQIATRDGHRVAYLGKVEVNGRVETIFSLEKSDEQA